MGSVWCDEIYKIRLALWHKKATSDEMALVLGCRDARAVMVKLGITLEFFYVKRLNLTSRMQIAKLRRVLGLELHFPRQHW